MDYRQCPWRVGTKAGRTIYAVVSPTHDVLIGTLDTPLLAEDAVHGHNVVLQVIRSQARRLTPEEEQERVGNLHLAMQAAEDAPA